MARDLRDFSTLDFVPADPRLTCGQVLVNRQRNIAIVIKHGRDAAQLVRLKSGKLKLTRLTIRELVADWSVAEYPFDEALPKLRALARQHGITETAKQALDKLEKMGREPLQTDLFV